MACTTPSLLSYQFAWGCFCCLCALLFSLLLSDITLLKDQQEKNIGLISFDKEQGAMEQGVMEQGVIAIRVKKQWFAKFRDTNKTCSEVMKEIAFSLSLGHSYRYCSNPVS